MERDQDSAGALEDQLQSLDEALAHSGTMAAAFDQELKRMQVSMAETNASVGTLSSSVSRGLRQAFDGLVLDGVKLSDALRTVANSIVNATYSAALKPVTNQLGGLVASGLASIGATAFAKGGTFTQGRVMPFAKGGVVTGPTHFPMRGGTGLMGEAGPEAIMPLTRGPDGSLGVRTTGGGARPVHVVMNISTPDAASFQRSQGQIAARASRALSRGDRNR